MPMESITKEINVIFAKKEINIKGVNAAGNFKIITIQCSQFFIMLFLTLTD